MYVHARAPWSCLPAGMSHMFTRRSTSVDVVGRLLLLLLLLSSSSSSSSSFSSSSSSSSEAIALVLLVRIPRCVMPVWGPGISISINRTVQRRRRRDREARFAGSSLRLVCIMHVWDVDQQRLRDREWRLGTGLLVRIHRYRCV